MQIVAEIFGAQLVVQIGNDLRCKKESEKAFEQRRIVFVSTDLDIDIAHFTSIKFLGHASNFELATSCPLGSQSKSHESYLEITFLFQAEGVKLVL